MTFCHGRLIIHVWNKINESILSCYRYTRYKSLNFSLRSYCRSLPAQSDCTNFYANDWSINSCNHPKNHVEAPSGYSVPTIPLFLFPSISFFQELKVSNREKHSLCVLFDLILIFWSKETSYFYSKNQFYIGLFY